MAHVKRSEFFDDIQALAHYTLLCAVFSYIVRNIEARRYFNFPLELQKEQQRQYKAIEPLDKLPWAELIRKSGQQWKMKSVINRESEKVIRKHGETAGEIIRLVSEPSSLVARCKVSSLPDKQQRARKQQKLKRSKLALPGLCCFSGRKLSNPSRALCPANFRLWDLFSRFRDLFLYQSLRLTSLSRLAAKVRVLFLKINDTLLLF